MHYYTDYPTEPSGNGNPYHRCIYCKRTHPEINGDLTKHSPDCKYRIEKQEELAVIKPCPFCGSKSCEVNLHEGTIWYVHCKKCLCRGPKHNSEKKSTSAWNKRSTYINKFIEK